MIFELKIVLGMMSLFVHLIWKVSGLYSYDHQYEVLFEFLSVVMGARFLGNISYSGKD